MEIELNLEVENLNLKLVPSLEIQASFLLAVLKWGDYRSVREWLFREFIVNFANFASDSGPFKCQCMSVSQIHYIQVEYQLKSDYTGCSQKYITNSYGDSND